MSDLDTLRPEVRKAFGVLDTWLLACCGKEATKAWQTIRAELLRLTGDLNAARLSGETFKAKYQCMRERAERAEAELAALKARIAEAPAVSLVYGQGDMLLVLSAENADDWAGKRVRLVVEK